VELQFAFTCGVLWARHVVKVFAQKMDKTLHEILDELEYRLGWGIWDERNAEALEQKRRRYLDSEMCECSDDYWRSIHYGPPCADSPDEESEESSVSMLRCRNLSSEFRQMMIEAN